MNLERAGALSGLLAITEIITHYLKVGLLVSKSRIRPRLTLPLKKRTVVIEDVVLLLIQIF